MILIIDDDEAVCASIQMLLRQNQYDSVSADGPEKALTSIRSQRPDLILMDMNFSLKTTGEEGLQLLKQIMEIDSTIPVIMITAWGSIDLAVEGMRAGANDFITKPWNNDHLLQSIITALELKIADKSIKLSRKQLESSYDIDHIIGENDEFLQALETACKVSLTEASILITGESGTGKELIAESVHVNSKRRNGPFVKVNLAGISATLFESEMFGHVKGAFTDAKADRVGRFELAHSGTIFLDEIGDLDLNSQVKLLRVLQDRSFERLGSSQTINADFRLICATNRNLEEMVSRGEFREDLYYRINLIRIKIPALRDRPDDISRLIENYLDKLKTIYQRPQLKIDNKAGKKIGFFKLARQCERTKKCS